MHPYSIDTEERKYVFLALAAFSILSVLIFHNVLNYWKVILPWWIEIHSVLFFYGIFFTFFDKWCWKRKFLKTISFIKTPDLNGKWVGYLKSSFDEHSSQMEATLQIFQTWTKIKILLNTVQSVSHSKSASIVINEPEGSHLSYQYVNEPKSNAVRTMSIHRGTTHLFFNEKDKVLVGEYYSGRDRQNFGSLYFKR